MKNKLYFILFAFCAWGCASCSHEEDHSLGEKYLGAKYIYDPLGEEKAPDKDPLIRTDAFDCVSFVETSLADGDVEKLNKIRYKNGEIGILTRNHFVEVDWLKNNSDLVEDVTRKYGKPEIKSVLIDKKNWFKKNYNMDTDFEAEMASIEYIPYERFPKIRAKEPMIVLFICDSEGFYEHTGSDLAIIHMGFLLPGNILRHASSKYGIVMDADFDQYVAQTKLNKHHIGMAFIRIKNDKR